MQKAILATITLVSFFAVTVTAALTTDAFGIAAGAAAGYIVLIACSMLFGLARSAVDSQ